MNRFSKAPVIRGAMAGCAALALTLFAAPLAQAQSAASRAGTARPAPATADELAELRAQLVALQARLEELEKAQQTQTQQVAAATAAVEEQKALNTELQDGLDRNADNLARTAANVGEWVGRFTFRGDLRYRNETIDQEFAPTSRNRDRIRARVGFVARVNDTVRAEVRLATGGSDPRSANQTLGDTSTTFGPTGPNSRKPIGLDLAFVEWQPNTDWRVTGGKMPMPWVRSGQSLFFDSDVNPEGLALAYQAPAPSGVYASAFYLLLSERSAQAESNVLGAQVGWRSNPAQSTRYGVGLGYFDFGAVEGYNPFFNGNAFGNTTTTSATVCRRGIATCLANDYDIVRVFGDFATVLGGHPFTAYADLAQNTAADDLDTAYSVGFLWGRASSPRSWEVGLSYQRHEKDALFAQFVDSNLGDGNTDVEGFVLRGGYQFARNWRLNLTYFLNDTNIDRAATVPAPTPAAPTATRTVFDREYRRLQVDLNMSF